jgi:hypothetical protein
MALQSSETLVNKYQSTWRYNPEDSQLHENPYFINSFLISLWTKCSQPFVLKNGKENRKVKDDGCYVGCCTL